MATAVHHHTFRDTVPARVTHFTLNGTPYAGAMHHRGKKDGWWSGLHPGPSSRKLVHHKKPMILPALVTIARRGPPTKTKTSFGRVAPGVYDLGQFTTDEGHYDAKHLKFPQRDASGQPISRLVVRSQPAPTMTSSDSANRPAGRPAAAPATPAKILVPATPSPAGPSRSSSVRVPPVPDSSGGASVDNELPVVRSSTRTANKNIAEDRINSYLDNFLARSNQLGWTPEFLEQIIAANLKIRVNLVRQILRERDAAEALASLRGS